MQSWPDLSRFGWSMGVLYQVIPGGKRQASGLYFESLRGSAPATVPDALAEAGFVAAAPIGNSPFRMESSRIKFNMADLESWFPGFDRSADMRERHPPTFIVEQPKTQTTAWFFDFNWPRVEDIEAVDSALGLHGWEYPAEAFARVAAERILRIDDEGLIVDPALATERMLDMLYGPEEAQKRNPALAERMLGRIAVQTDAALKSGTVVAIERLGDKVLMPPLRVFRAGEAVTTAFADHKQMVTAALPDYPVPEAALQTYPEWADPNAAPVRLELDIAAELAVLEGYPGHETVAELYDRDDAFSGALVRLIPNFEYPDYSHLTVDKVRILLAKRYPPVAEVPGEKLTQEINNLRQIHVISQRLGLEFDIKAMASTALRESGHLDEVFEARGTLDNPGTPALQAALEETSPFSEAHMALTEIVQAEVVKDASASIERGEMPVYRVTELLCVAMHPSSRTEGMIQATRYATDGLIGDSQYNSLEEAVRSEGLWFVPRLSTEDAAQVLADSIKAEAGFQDWKAKVTSTADVVETAEVDVVKNPKVRRTRKPKEDDRIEDVGEKIGGARKDFYKRALSVSDLPTMNALETDALVRKAHVWPWSVKEALEAGVEPCVIQWVKTLRRYIREFGDRTCYMPAQDPARYIQGVEMLRDGIGNPKTKAELTENLKAFRLSLYENDQWMPFKHPITGEKVSNSQYYKENIRAEVTAVGQKAFDMADADFTTHYNNTARSYSDAQFRPAQWYNSKAEYFEKNPDYGRSRLIPTRRTVTKGDSDIVMPERPHLLGLIQSGFSDARGGRDIEAAELLSKFGFRAIEFGNWVPQDERQSVINMAYDAMHALCETLGVEPKMASLHGELALAFGARGRGGKGAAMAHYEPSRKVINLTRIKGAGSLMHEWVHAKDNYLGELFSGKPGQFLCNQPLENFVNRSTVPEMKADGVSSSHIEHHLRSGFILPTPAWRDTAISMAAVLQAMTVGEKSQDVILREAESLGALRVEWAASWIRNDLVTFFRSKAGDDKDLRFAANKAGEVTAMEIVKKAIADHTKLEWSGLWQAFPAEVVAEQIKAEIRIDYGIRLNKKSDTQLERCLNTVAHNIGRAQMMKLTPEEQAAFQAEHPEYPLGVFANPKQQTPSNFVLNSKKLDKGRSKAYWGEKLELLARAGEQYIFYTMQENGCQADYLVHGVEENRFASEKVLGNPYPAGDERKAIAGAMKSLFDNGCQLIRERAQELEQKARPAEMGMVA